MAQGKASAPVAVSKQEHSRVKVYLAVTEYQQFECFNTRIEADQFARYNRLSGKGSVRVLKLYAEQA